MKALLITARNVLRRVALRKNLLIASLLLVSGDAALAAEATTSATVGNGIGRTPTAAATADYAGDRGFTRSEATSGPISTARGVALGVDEDGLSLSISNAIAPQHGPAIATNYNLSVGRDGRVSSSAGLAIADGPVHREARTSGGTATTGNGGGATSIAEGSSDRFGTVRTHSIANDTGPRRATPGISPARRVANSRFAIADTGVRGVRRGVIAPRRTF
ncbi:MAG: hypothetical protein SF069_07035 [Phycisphaerae bacterium]|nr:hypothetical protein [Phycisphaerae bacterium]